MMAGLAAHLAKAVVQEDITCNMPSEFTKLADSLAEGYASNPFSKWLIKVELIDASTNEVERRHTRAISGTEYGNTLFEDIKSVLEGEKDIVD